MKQTSQEKKLDNDEETNKQTKWCSSAHYPDPLEEEQKSKNISSWKWVKDMAKIKVVKY